MGVPYMKMRDGGSCVGPLTHVYSAMEALAFDCKVDKAKLYKIIGKEGFVTAETADRIISGLGQPYLWYNDPELSKLYQEIYG